MIVAECWLGGERVRALTRRSALDPSHIYGWHKTLVRRPKDRGVPVPTALERHAPPFVPIMIAPDDTPVKRVRFTEEQTIGVLKMAEAGAMTAVLARRHRGV